MANRVLSNVGRVVLPTIAVGVAYLVYQHETRPARIADAWRTFSREDLQRGKLGGLDDNARLINGDMKRPCVPTLRATGNSVSVLYCRRMHRCFPRLADQVAALMNWESPREVWGASRLWEYTHLSTPRCAEYVSSGSVRALSAV
jgi:hypothetical protein